MAYYKLLTNHFRRLLMKRRERSGTTIQKISANGDAKYPYAEREIKLRATL